MPDSEVTVASAGVPPFSVQVSRQLPAWMQGQRLSLAFTTYEAGKLFLIGLQDDGRISVFERTFNRCMGLCASGNAIWMSSLYQLWKFENTLDPGSVHQGYDRVYVPRVAYTTGDLDVHDVAVDGHSRPIFVNTLFSCLATVSETHSFVPLWKPPFISRLAAEDRCHLNGLACADGVPRFVTAAARADLVDGWRQRRVDGGIVVDVSTGEIVTGGLSMPHSPRLHNGALWLHESGTGWFGRIDLARGSFERLTFCPGYLRGLAFHGNFAIAGVSRLRGDNTALSGLPLDAALKERSAAARTGLLVIDLASGDIVHWLQIEGIVAELYDVVVLPQVRRPMAIGFKTDEIRRLISIGS